MLNNLLREWCGRGGCQPRLQRARDKRVVCEGAHSVHARHVHMRDLQDGPFAQQGGRCIDVVDTRAVDRRGELPSEGATATQRHIAAIAPSPAFRLVRRSLEGIGDLRLRLDAVVEPTGHQVVPLVVCIVGTAQRVEVAEQQHRLRLDTAPCGLCVQPELLELG